MPEQHLVLHLPQGMLVATSLDAAAHARHGSPGSGKYFNARSIRFELALDDGGKPSFEFLDEGGWRDAKADTLAALGEVGEGKRTKTALSNNAFSCTPLEAYRHGYLAKTGGQLLELTKGVEVLRFSSHDCSEEMTPDDVRKAAGGEATVKREPRLYMVLCPVALLVMSNLTPAEYAWYATHRPGKIFRQVLFTELDRDPTRVAAESVFRKARESLAEDPSKKTKTVLIGSALNSASFSDWVGYGSGDSGGLFVADREHITLWGFPDSIPHEWDRVSD